ASLTKIVTATAALRLCAQGILTLDTPVTNFLPHSQAHAVTIRHLLTHTSGLDVRLSTVAQFGADALWQAVLACAPTHAPGSRVAYANVNTLLLGRILEQTCYLPLTSVLTQQVLAPAGMMRTSFTPAPADHAAIPPTEQTTERGVVQGVVHDESTAALGGVAGHAGLFGDAADLIAFGRAWLATLHGQGPWGIAATLAREAIRNQSPTGQLGCGLGWMLARDNFMAPAVLHDTAAHTGFTGPVIAIVPRLDQTWVILSNRTWPQRIIPPQHHEVTKQISAVLSMY
ncbi:MAG: serine hydrolase domain-containing protein, partial [Roseiflexaceae bacterium]